MSKEKVIKEVVDEAIKSQRKNVDKVYKETAEKMEEAIGKSSKKEIEKELGRNIDDIEKKTAEKFDNVSSVKEAVEDFAEKQSSNSKDFNTEKKAKDYETKSTSNSHNEKGADTGTTETESKSDIKKNFENTAEKMMNNKYVKTAMGAGIVVGGYDLVFGSNKGQQTNAQLYGQSY